MNRRGLMQHAVGFHHDFAQQGVGVAGAALLIKTVLIKAAEGAVGGAKGDMQIDQPFARRRRLADNILPGLRQLFFGDGDCAAPRHGGPAILKGLLSFESEMRAEIQRLCCLHNLEVTSI